MSWRLHGGVPLLSNGLVAIDADCCCATGCTLPCDPYTSYDVSLDVTVDSISNASPDCTFWEYTGIWTPAAGVYCWPFASPPPNGFFPNSKLPWMKIIKIAHTTSGLQNLSFAVNLPLTIENESACCVYKPSGSPSTINGQYKQFTLGEVTDTCTITLENYWVPGQRHNIVTTRTFDYSVWLAAGCFFFGDIGTRTVNGYIEAEQASFTINTNGYPNCNCPTSGAVNCPDYDFFSRHYELVIYPNDFATSGYSVEQIPRGDRRTGSDCVQSSNAASIELVRYTACNQLVRSTKAPFTFTVEAAL